MTQDRTSHLLAWLSRFISDTKSCNWNSEKPQKASTSPLYRSPHEESGKLIHTRNSHTPWPKGYSSRRTSSPSKPAVHRESLGICPFEWQRREVPPDWPSTEVTFTSMHTVQGNFRQEQRTQCLLYPNLLLSNQNLSSPRLSPCVANDLTLTSHETKIDICQLPTWLRRSLQAL